MLSFRVFAKLQHRLEPQAALPRLPIVFVPFVELLYFQILTHSFARRTTRICFSFSRFHALSIATEGVGVPTLQNLNYLPPIPFHFKLLRTLLHFFALIENSTLLFSNDSSLCVKKPGPAWGGGGLLTSHPSFNVLGVPSAPASP